MKKNIFIFLVIALLITPMKNSTMIAQAKMDQVVVNGQSAYVRTGPNISDPIIDEIYSGSAYDVVEIKGDWIKLKLNGLKSGWVSERLVTGYEKADLSSNSGIVTTDGLRIRTGPGTDFEVLGNLPIGTIIQISQVQNGWISFTYQNNLGWVNSQYIQQHPSQKSPKKIRITASELMVRKTETSNSKTIGTVLKDQVYTVLDKKDKMYKIELSSNKAGWIPSWYAESEGEQDIILQRKGLKGKTIILDAGHGGTDSGASGPAGTLEKNLTLHSVNLTYEKLKKAGAKIIMTRSSDRYVTLSARANLANLNSADAFISFHYDSNHDGNKSGIKTYYYYAYQKKLASTIQEHLLQNNIALNDQGIKQSSLHVLRENRQPAILLELGYINNPAEEAFIQTEHYQETITDSLVNGLAAYFTD